MLTSTALSSLQRPLLVKAIAYQQPVREDVSAAIASTTEKLARALQAQFLRFHVDEGPRIWMPPAYFSAGLWQSDPAKEKLIRAVAAEQYRTERSGAGVIDRVIETGLPIISHGRDLLGAGMAESTGFGVTSMLIVPLRSTIILGAIQAFNKEATDGVSGGFTDGDLELLQEVAEYSCAIIHRMLDPKFQLSPPDKARFVARLTGLPLVTSLEKISVDEALARSIGGAVIEAQAVFPSQRLGPSSISVYMPNPLDQSGRDSFSQVTRLQIDEVSVISTTIFESLMSRYFKAASRASQGGAVDLESVAAVVTTAYAAIKAAEAPTGELEDKDSGPVVQLANRLIEDAFHCGASDIHIEPTQKELVVRYRIDGLCQHKLRLPQETAAALVARIKVMCNLDISEKRLPQDGRIIFKRFSKREIDIDLRVAVAPTNHGEKVTLRVLDKEKTMLPLSALGFSEENLAKYRDCVGRPHGMILHCGPTGSGKSMTLYSALAEVNTPDMNIVTAEDPIEYTLPGINQTQMNRQIGLTFARALRSFLRMDPDIILVGEIRDQETAQIAVEAALTGHLLVSTLHTNDAATTIARLCEMNVEPFNISASLVCVCAQRLLRRVCPRCSRLHEPKDRDEEMLRRAIGWSGPIRKANPKGCPACGGISYKGRVGIHELMVNDEELTEAINRGAKAAELKSIATKNGMKTLYQDAMLKVSLGVTTLEEALITTPSDVAISKLHAAVANPERKLPD